MNKRQAARVSLIAALMIIMCFLSMVCLAEEDPNFIMNGDFSADANAPLNWQASMWDKTYGASFLELTTETGADGACVLIENQLPNDARFVQTVAVTPNTWYRLSARIKTANVSPDGVGANLSLLGVNMPPTSVYSGDWVQSSICFKTNSVQREVEVALRLGGYSNLVTGRAWFDDVSLEKIDAPSDEEYSFIVPEPSASQVTESTEERGNADYMWLTLPLFALAIYFALAKQSPPRYVTITLFGVAAALRLLIAYTTKGYDVDIGCFSAWASRVFEVGPASFYATDYFCDYPPGYIIMLYPIGALLSLFNHAANPQLLQLCVKLIPILFDMAIIALIYHIGEKRRGELGERAGYSMALIYAFNPVSLTISAAWGQSDIVLAFGLILAFSFASKGEWRYAIPAYFATVLVKPQALIAGPIGLAALIYYLASEKWKSREVIRAVIGIAAGLAIAAVVIVPFGYKMGYQFLPEKYFDTMQSYDYATVNATNLFFMLGGNWVSSSRTLFASVTYAHVSYALIALVVLFAIYLYIRSGDKKHLFMLAALTFLGVFAFGFRMHERYIFPAIALFLLAYTHVRDGRLVVVALVLSVSSFFNVWLVLQNQHMVGETVAFIGYILSYVTVLTTIYAFFTCHEICVQRKTVTVFSSPSAKVRLDRSRGSLPPYDIFKKSDSKLSMKPKDYAIMLGITAIYAALAFVNLGDTAAPQTWWRASSTDEVIMFDLGEQREFTIMYYNGISPSGFTFNTALSGDYYASSECFTWNYVLSPVEGATGTTYNSELPVVFNGRYVRLTPDTPGIMLLEVAFKDLDGNVIPVSSINRSGGRAGYENGIDALIDEQQYVPSEPSYMNGTYFDEIYHARTGFEYLHKLQPLETSHPPLGKVFIMWSISLLGMTPFAWRLPGTIAGILMIPAMYLLAKQLFKRTKWATLAALLLTLDTMHFAQTRIATIDSYPVLFIILMFLCIYRYFKMSFFADGLPRTLVPLLLCGVFMSLAISSKWIGIYAAIGVAVILFWSFVRRLIGYFLAVEQMDALSEDERKRVRMYPKYMIATILWCVLVFIVIPIGIYTLSYIPDLTASGKFTIQRVVDAQISMFNYHSRLTESHPFQSMWYEWLVGLRPMWFYQGHFEPEGMASTILTFGNPVIWLSGLVALLALAVLAIRNAATFNERRLTPRNGETSFSVTIPAIIVIGYLAQFVPWTLIPRAVFIYHYFASTIFIILAIVFHIARLDERGKRASNVLYVSLVALSALVFAALYPFASGALMPEWYASLFTLPGLKLPGWPFGGVLFH